MEYQNWPSRRPSPRAKSCIAMSPSSEYQTYTTPRKKKISRKGSGKKSRGTPKTPKCDSSIKKKPGEGCCDDKKKLSNKIWMLEKEKKALKMKIQNMEREMDEKVQIETKRSNIEFLSNLRQQILKMKSSFDSEIEAVKSEMEHQFKKQLELANSKSEEKRKLEVRSIINLNKEQVRQSKMHYIRLLNKNSSTALSNGKEFLHQERMLNDMEIKWANERKMLESQIQKLKEELVHQEERLKKKFGAVCYETGINTARQWTASRHYSTPNSVSSGYGIGSPGSLAADEIVVSIERAMVEAKHALSRKVEDRHSDGKP